MSDDGSVTLASGLRCMHVSYHRVRFHLPSFFSRSRVFLKQFCDLCLKRIVGWLQDCREQNESKRMAKLAHVPWVDLANLPDREINMTLSNTKNTIEVTTLDDVENVASHVILGVVAIVEGLLYRTRCMGLDSRHGDAMCSSRETMRMYSSMCSQYCKKQPAPEIFFYSVCLHHVCNTCEPVVFTVDPHMRIRDECKIAKMQHDVRCGLEVA